MYSTVSLYLAGLNPVLCNVSETWLKTPWLVVIVVTVSVVFQNEVVDMLR